MRLYVYASIYEKFTRNRKRTEEHIQMGQKALQLFITLKYSSSNGKVNI